MSRHRPGGGYGHHIQWLGPDHYRLSWSWDAYYASSRLRHPRKMTRDTDRAGADRFAKKHGIKVPDLIYAQYSGPRYGA